MGLSLLIDKIHCDKGFDLRGYKDSTLKRRIERRLQLDGAKSLEEYIRMIDKDQHLYRRLISDCFIGVTGFFRDKEIWEVMKDKVLPEIIERKLSSVSHQREIFPCQAEVKPALRVWCCGCADGREPYSLAICLQEILKERTADLEIKIFATDINEEIINKARKGEYKAESVSSLPDFLREEYFTPFEKDFLTGCTCCKTRMFKIKKQIRDMLTFGTHNLVSDFYIGNLDLIVCRNVLIYFQRKLQDKVLVLFHKALKRGGILWLGTAEGLSKEVLELFEPVCDNKKIFRKIQRD